MDEPLSNLDEELAYVDFGATLPRQSHRYPGGDFATQIRLLVNEPNLAYVRNWHEADLRPCLLSCPYRVTIRHCGSRSRQV